ncbi:MAG: YggT family protein [Chloroflexota bacterium]
MFIILANAIGIFSQVLTFLVLAHVILSYFMNPYHPVRQFIDRMVDPLLSPIRKIVPLIGMMDFSPVILIILVQFISDAIVKILITL